MTAPNITEEQKKKDREEQQRKTDERNKREAANNKSTTGEKKDEEENKEATQLLDKLNSIAQENPNLKGRPPAAQRNKSTNNPTPPEDRKPGPIGVQQQALDSAAGAITAARSQVESQIASDKRLKSDPRYERDQQIYEMGQTGKLSLVPKTEEEVAAQARRSGLEPEDLDKIPKSSDEQAQRDMARLDEAKAQQAKQAPVPSGEKEEDKRKREEDAGDASKSKGTPIPSAAGKPQ